MRPVSQVHPRPRRSPPSHVSDVLSVGLALSAVWREYKRSLWETDFSITHHPPPPAVQTPQSIHKRTTECSVELKRRHKIDLSQLPKRDSVSLSPSRVPASKLSRLLQYTSLAARVSAGSASEAVKRMAGLSDAASNSSLIFTPQNTEKIVARLTRMRGAALKLGQMLSIQDNNKLFPSQVEHIIARVQNSANYMPLEQLEGVMRRELGEAWREHFKAFPETPAAAASIGQVHKATLQNGTVVAVKVQASIFTCHLRN